MSVVFELIDAPYPHLCALYRCACGAESTRFGDEAAVPPPGWTIDPPADEGDEHVSCPRCGAAAPQRPS